MRSTGVKGATRNLKENNNQWIPRDVLLRTRQALIYRYERSWKKPKRIN